MKEKKESYLNLKIAGEFSGEEAFGVGILFVDDEIVVCEKLRGEPVACSFHSIIIGHFHERGIWELGDV